MLLYLSTCSTGLSFSSINTWVSLQTHSKMLDAFRNKQTEKQMTPVSAETHSVSLDSRKARSSGESTGSLSNGKKKPFNDCVAYLNKLYYIRLYDHHQNTKWPKQLHAGCLPEALGVHAHQVYHVCQPHPGKRTGIDILVNICQVSLFGIGWISSQWQKLLTSLPGFPGGPDGPRGPRAP